MVCVCVVEWVGIQLLVIILYVSPLYNNRQKLQSIKCFQRASEKWNVCINVVIFSSFMDLTHFRTSWDVAVKTLNGMAFNTMIVVLSHFHISTAIAMLCFLNYQRKKQNFFFKTQKFVIGSEEATLIYITKCTRRSKLNLKNPKKRAHEFLISAVLLRSRTFNFSNII